MKFRQYLIIGLLVILPATAHADCSNNMSGSPGTAGQIEYFSTNELKYCDGTNWIAMSAPCGGAQATCGGDPARRVVFLSTTTAADARLGGLFGADSRCTRQADLAGLSGIYYAWLADTDPAHDPVNRFEHSTVPYVLNNANTGLTVQVADDWNDLVDCTGSCLDTNIKRGADGVVIATNSAHTNVNTDGTATSNVVNNCAGWTQSSGVSAIGNTNNTNPTWS